ncbi:MAG TPA: hypothetical protein VMV44_09415 [Rectinemataceae bacterium]|nr:hypothetical protein [Rectinemataceae bacterium]
MGLLSELVAQGRVRNRDDLRRVYRRLVKRLHPDSAASRGEADAAREGGSIRADSADRENSVSAREAAAQGGDATRPLPFVDFDELRKELGEAERLLAELDGIDDRKGSDARHALKDGHAHQQARGHQNPGQGTEGGDAGVAAKEAGSASTTGRGGSSPAAAPASFDRNLLIGELRDLVARGFPVQPRALARNKAYRHCVATISAQLALLTGEPDAFIRIDAEMRAVRASSLSLIYHVMQVLWNGLDWGLMGMDWSRLAALRDYGVIKEQLAAKGLVALDRLLSWIIEADQPPPSGDRTGQGGRLSR